MKHLAEVVALGCLSLVMGSCVTAPPLIGPNGQPIAIAGWIQDLRNATATLEQDLPLASDVAALTGTPAQLAKAQADLVIVQTSLPAEMAALDALARAPNVNGACAARAIMSFSLTMTLIFAQDIAAMGYQPEAAMLDAAELVGSIIEGALPACVGDAGPSVSPAPSGAPSPVTSAAVRAFRTSLPAGLRPLR